MNFLTSELYERITLCQEINEYRDSLYRMKSHSFSTSNLTVFNTDHSSIENLRLCLVMAKNDFECAVLGLV